MPKTNMGRIRRKKRPYEDALAMIQGAKARSTLSNDEFLARSNMRETTMRQRFQHPEEIRLDELCRMCEALELELTIQVRYPDEIDVTATKYRPD